MDFLSKKGIDLTEVEKILKKWNLYINNDKTEVSTIERNNYEWKSCKKLGMLLNAIEEWKKRKTISIVTMAKLSKIWSSKISRKKKIRIYSAYVQSIMLFGCSTLEMDKGMEQLIDSFNRRMIRQACGSFRPNRMFTEKVNTLAEPVFQIVPKRSWRKLGHIFRMNDLVPAGRATMECLASKNKKRKIEHQSPNNH